MLSGFKDFILRGNVVDLAVGVVIGAAFGGIVTALVEDLLTPLIGAIAKVPDFSAWVFALNGSTFKIGDFINHVISFVLVAGAIYFFVVTPVNKLMANSKKDAVPTTKGCPECASDIPLKATRCGHCTTKLA
jgi:large conductance mechanosensitive channel